MPLLQSFSYYRRRLRKVLDDLRMLLKDTRTCWFAGRWKIQPCVLIVRLDNIGDFLLWFEAAVRLCEHYRSKRKRIVLLANATWSALAENLDVFDEVWALDRRRFGADQSYRAHLMRRLRRAGFEIAIQPTYSRELLIGDAVVRMAGRKARIGSCGDLSNRDRQQKWMGDHFYTKLIQASPREMSELERNAEFMRGLGIDCSARLRPLPLPERSGAELRKLAGSGSYFVIFPGASREGRCWPASAFAEVARRVANATGWQGVVAGGPGDRDATSAVVRSCEVPLLDLTGATDLLELAVLLKGARFVVSNETSAAHLAAALSTPSVCIVGGGHFARFLPYPAGVADEVPRSVFRPMDCFNCNWQCRYPRNPGEPFACIKAVSIEEVCQATKELLASSCNVPLSAWQLEASA